MLGRRTLPSGRAAREVVNEARQTWIGEVVPRVGKKRAHIRVSSPVDFELSDLTAGHMQQALDELREDLWIAKDLDRRGER